MVTDLDEQFIVLKTNFDGWFIVTIVNLTGTIIYSKAMRSHNKQIVLKGFSLEKESITISPLK